MAIEQYYSQYNVLTPINTATTSPLITQVNLGDVMLHKVRIRIPPGHSGQTGIQIRLGSNTIIPWNDATKFIVGNDDRLEFDYEDEVTTGLTIATYNVGNYPHTFYVTFVNTPISLSQVQTNAVQPVGIA